MESVQQFDSCLKQTQVEVEILRCQVFTAVVCLSFKSRADDESTDSDQHPFTQALLTFLTQQLPNVHQWNISV